MKLHQLHESGVTKQSILRDIINLLDDAMEGPHYEKNGSVTWFTQELFGDEIKTERAKLKGLLDGYFKKISDFAIEWDEHNDSTTTVVECGSSVFVSVELTSQYGDDNGNVVVDISFPDSIEKA